MKLIFTEREDIISKQQRRDNENSREGDRQHMSSSDEKVDALMRLFDEERARHREAEIAAESRIRLLENRLKDFDLGQKRGTTSSSTTSAAPAATSSRKERSGPDAGKRAATTPAANNATGGSRNATPNSRKVIATPASRQTAHSTAPRPSDSLFAATPSKKTTATTTTPRRRVAGSPKGSPSGVDNLLHASEAPSSRSERLAAARAKRMVDQRLNGKKTASASASSSTATATATSRPKSWASTSGKPAAAPSSTTSAGRRATTPPASQSKRAWNNRGGSVNPLQEQAWNKFCAQAKDKFTAEELIAISNETLQQLMDHFSITSAVERARVEAHWAHLNAPPAAAVSSSSSSTPGRGRGGPSAATGGSSTTPSRRLGTPVQELKFPDHPQDFNLRTTVPPDLPLLCNMTPRKLLRPEAPRGANIDTHEFSSAVRTPRTVTLLRSRSPATAAPAFHLQKDLPAHLQEKVNSKQVVSKPAAASGGPLSGAEEKPHAKRMFEKVPGADTADVPHGKRGASSIPGAAKATRSTDDVDGPKHSKRMTQRPATADEEPRRGLKMPPARDPMQSRDAARYIREQAQREQPRLITDATLSTPTLSKLVGGGGGGAVAAARKLPPQQPTAAAAAAPAVAVSAYQLKTPFAVDR